MNCRVFLTFVFLILLNLEIPQAFAQMVNDHELLNSWVRNLSEPDPITDKYVYKIAYVGMREEDFVPFYSKSSETINSLKPHIIKHTKNIYYLHKPSTKVLKIKYSNISDTGLIRFTFNKGVLIKYEVQRLGKPPFVFPVFSNYTYLLEGKPNGAEPSQQSSL